MTQAWGCKSPRDTDQSELEAMDSCGAAVLPNGLWTAQPQLVADAPARRSLWVRGAWWNADATARDVDGSEVAGEPLDARCDEVVGMVRED